MGSEPGPLRVLPLLTDLNREYWTGGFEGELRIRRCRACHGWQHPPAPVCQRCLSRDIAAEPVSGNGTIGAYTINYHRWSPTSTTEPYVVAIVDLPEDPGLRLTTNIVSCLPTDVRIGMDVRVQFETIDDISLPFFAPVDSSDA